MLSEKERAALRGDIVAFMKANPVRNTNVARHHTYGARDAQSTASFITVKRKRMISAILLAMFALSGGVSYAAEGSLPGDMLYPVKIHINEGVEGSLAIGAKADAEFAQKQLNRRAQEAEALARENRLDDEAKRELSNESRMHLKASAEAEAKMRHDEEGGEEARKAHKEVVDTILEHEEVFLKLGVSAHTDGNVSVEGIDEAKSENIESDTNVKVHTSLFQSIFGGAKEVGEKVQTGSSSRRTNNDSGGSLNSHDELKTNISLGTDVNNNEKIDGAHIETENSGNVQLQEIPNDIRTEIKTEGGINIGL